MIRTEKQKGIGKPVNSANCHGLETTQRQGKSLRSHNSFNSPDSQSASAQRRIFLADFQHLDQQAGEVKYGSD